MTTSEIQAAWQASYEKHYARLLDAATVDPSLNRVHRLNKPGEIIVPVSTERKVECILAQKGEAVEQIIAKAREAADEDIRLLTRPQREF